MGFTDDLKSRINLWFLIARGKKYFNECLKYGSAFKSLKNMSKVFLIFNNHDKNVSMRALISECVSLIIALYTSLYTSLYESLCVLSLQYACDRLKIIFL